jgi:hypothetical protein
MFRTATDADVKNFSGAHSSRYLWKLPVKKALAVVQDSDTGVSEKRKRARYDDDGDVNMGTEVCTNVPWFYCYLWHILQSCRAQLVGTACYAQLQVRFDISWHAPAGQHMSE